jgi:hypothetical protein
MSWFSSRPPWAQSTGTTVVAMYTDENDVVMEPTFVSSMSGDAFRAISPAEAQDVDAFMAHEINKLSFQERNLIQEEIHGVHSLAPQETPELLQSALDHLGKELYAHIMERAQFCSAHQNQQDLMFYQALSTALASSPYLKSVTFRLRFLRADLMDAKKAAVRLVGNLKLLCKYFGEIALQRPLRFKDLGELEQDVLRQGVYQILPSRDRAKRLIIFHHGAYEGDNVTNVQRIRVHLYFSCVLSEDVETQKNGLVILFSADNRILDHLAGSKEDFIESVATSPLRWSGIHLCLPKGPAYQLLKAFLILTIAGTDQRIRVKCHPELPNMETQYQLMCYGIPVQELPISFTGTTKTKNLNQWIQTRVAIDEVREHGFDTSSLVVHPGTCDVLFSKGGNARHHGNLEFHQSMESRIDAYNATSSRKEKRKIRNEIIASVRARQGRFLEMAPNGCWWVEILDPDVIHSKVTSAINDQTRTMRARQNRQKTQSESRKFLDANKRRKIEETCCK